MFPGHFFGKRFYGARYFGPDPALAELPRPAAHPAWALCPAAAREPSRIVRF